MGTETTPPEGAAERIDELLATASLLCEGSLVGQLDQQDKQMLRQRAGDRAGSTSNSDRKAAMMLIGRHDDHADEVLAAIIGDTNEDPRLRATAASGLVAKPGARGEAAVRDSLVEAPEPLRSEFIDVLGRVGGTEALTLLRGLPEPEGDRAKVRLDFAKQLIEFREGEQDVVLNDAAESDRRSERLLEIELEPIGAREIEKRLSHVLGSTYSIPINEELAFRYRCGDVEHTLLLHSALTPGRIRDVLLERKMIAGVVVAQEHGSDLQVIRLVVFSEPGRDRGLTITTRRSDGRLSLSGTAVAAGDVLRFQLRDVGVERSPTVVEGELGNSDIQLRARVSDGPLQPKQPGRSIEN